MDKTLDYLSLLIHILVFLISRRFREATLDAVCKHGSVHRQQEHRLAGADRSSIFFLKVKGLSFSITKEGGVE
ncbi:hypothetical protein DPMN_169461 [Dreissena polymorpha]|uniref:Secreted protein n=1 Tax=Dreissena polymorpha TaxID=45954 RepID=A0A9D4DUQ5_DREPO|nr:hypothetical protein DPMN_169461 [Dreissena polymorpha]